MDPKLPLPHPNLLVVDVHVVVHRGVVHSRVVDNHSHGVVDSHGVDDHAGVDSHRVVAHSRVVVAHIPAVVVHSQAVAAHSHGVEDDHMGQEVDGHMASSCAVGVFFLVLRMSFCNICN